MGPLPPSGPRHAGAGSLESALAGRAWLFVDTRRDAPTVSLASLAARTDDFTYASYGWVDDTTLGDACDGLFYLRDITPATIDR